MLYHILDATRRAKIRQFDPIVKSEDRSLSFTNKVVSAERVEGDDGGDLYAGAALKADDNKFT